MRKRTILLLAVPPAVVALILVVSLVSFDSPALGSAALNAAGEATKLQLTAEKFRLNLLKGLVLTNVHVQGELFDRNVNAQIGSLELKHRILPLLKGTFSVRSVVMERPVIECTAVERARKSPPAQRSRKESARKSETPSAAVEPEQENVEMEISKVTIQDAEITFREKKNLPPDALIKSLDVQLQDLIVLTTEGSVLNSLSASGDFDSDEVYIGDTQIHKTKGVLKADKGTLKVSEAEFTTKHGTFKMDVALNLQSSPLQYEFKLNGDPLDTNAIFGANGKGTYGPAKLQLDVRGAGPDSQNLKGTGTFSVAGGSLPSSETLAAIEWIIGKTKLIGADYKATSTPIQVQDGKVHISQFLLEVEKASLQLSGSIYLKGQLSMKLDVKAPRENIKIKEVPNEVLDALTDDSGWVSIPFQVRGSSREPNVYLDTQALFAQAGQGAVKVIKKRLKDRIRDFLNKQ